MASPFAVHLIGLDIRTKEQNLCVSLRLCVRCLFAGTARTFVDSFCLTQRRKVSQSICGVKFLFVMRGGGYNGCHNTQYSSC